MNIIFVVAFLVGILADGIVISLLWSWFLVPTLHLPPIGLVQAMGIGLLVSYMVVDLDSASNKNKRVYDSAEEELGAAFGKYVIFPVLMLIVGFIIHLFMPIG